MLTLLISSALVLGLLLVAVYFWQKPAGTPDSIPLPPSPEPRGLFAEPESQVQIEAAIVEDRLRESILSQAAAGDRSSLEKARQLKDEDLYDQVLTDLVRSTTTDAQLLSLTSYVTRNEWPVNRTLARACIESWKKAPDSTSTTKTLHIAALSDDAETYQTAAELAVRFWRDKKLPGLTAVELNALLNGEFWVLSSATRSSGAGFILKRTLASARRELEQTNTTN
ncbi:MAG TPA: hypothetical protein VLA93_09455 [Pyrinomonadaceae bacterium]|nr:hypothetical protein [Pyrinomonadaceae bacterium]